VTEVQADDRAPPITAAGPTPRRAAQSALNRFGSTIATSVHEVVLAGLKERVLRLDDLGGGARAICYLTVARYAARSSYRPC
jgi:hypothetical protein